jgi:hypothetical protein
MYPVVFETHTRLRVAPERTDPRLVRWEMTDSKNTIFGIHTELTKNEFHWLVYALYSGRTKQLSELRHLCGRSPSGVSNPAVGLVTALQAAPFLLSIDRIANVLRNVYHDRQKVRASATWALFFCTSVRL